MDEEVFNEEEKCIYQKSHFEDKEDFMANLEIIIQNKASTQDCSKALVRLGDVLDLYQEQPHLLDPYLESFIQPVMQTLRENIDSWLQENGANKGVPEDTIRLFRFLYLLTKTRGYKTIVKFMPHEFLGVEIHLFYMVITYLYDTLRFEENRQCQPITRLAGHQNARFMQKIY
ncbi:hypothetical protein RMATCC62417_13696 [Rhizopus microsporus]|nr:hypothetical protein RMATCC62417_13696 [Rhizopus microsporus]